MNKVNKPDRHEIIEKRLESKYPNYSVQFISYLASVIYVRVSDKEMNSIQVLTDMETTETAEGCQVVEDKLSDFILAAQKIGLLK